MALPEGDRIGSCRAGVASCRHDPIGPVRSRIDYIHTHNFPLARRITVCCSTTKQEAFRRRLFPIILVGRGCQGIALEWLSPVRVWRDIDYHL